MVDTPIEEARNVAASIAAIKGFIYDFVSSINTQGAKDYPLILIDAAPRQIRGAVNNHYLPRRKKYVFRVFCYDTYHEEQRKLFTLEQKQASVELILENFLAEWMRRTVHEIKTHLVTLSDVTIDGHLTYEVHNDKLVQASYNVEVSLDPLCELIPITPTGCDSVVYTLPAYWACEYSD